MKTAPTTRTRQVGSIVRNTTSAPKPKTLAARLGLMTRMRYALGPRWRKAYQQGNKSVMAELAESAVRFQELLDENEALVELARTPAFQEWRAALLSQQRTEQDDEDVIAMAAEGQLKAFIRAIERQTIRQIFKPIDAALAADVRGTRMLDRINTDIHAVSKEAAQAKERNSG